MINLSPSPDRIGRACVCVLEGQKILMVSYDDFFTFPGGGVNSGETFEEAAKLEHLEPSPEGRIVQWVNALEFPWCEDKQIKPALQALELRGGL
jgi:hypothetical protein